MKTQWGVDPTVIVKVRKWSTSLVSTGVRMRYLSSFLTYMSKTESRRATLLLVPTSAAGQLFRCKVGRHLPDRTKDRPKSMSEDFNASIVNGDTTVERIRDVSDEG